MNWNPFAVFTASRDAPPSARSTELDRLIAKIDGANKASAGVSVTTESALRVAVVLACVRVIAEGVGQLPLRIYKRDGDQRAPVRDDPIATLLSRFPNEYQTGFEFRETLTMHAALTGNGVAVKTRNNRGQVVELLPLAPAQYVIKQAADYSLVYEARDAQNRKIGDLTTADVLHIRGPSWNSYSGMDAVAQAREAIGLTIAAEKSQGRLHKNGARPAGVLTTDQTVNADVVGRLREEWKSKFTGDDQHGTAVVDGGWKYQAMSMTGVDAQHLETRRFQIQDVCRAFNVFPQMVMETSGTSTYASAESFFSAHVRHTLKPWLARWAQAVDRDLLDKRGPLECDFETREMTKAATADREKFIRTVVETGVMTRNEVRALEGLAPLPGLDDPLTPLNMTTGTSPAPE